MPKHICKPATATEILKNLKITGKTKKAAARILKKHK